MRLFRMARHERLVLERKQLLPRASRMLVAGPAEAWATCGGEASEMLPMRRDLGLGSL
jgi:hypothetical protein